MSCYVMLWCVILCYVMLCYALLCYALLCYVLQNYVMLCYVMPSINFRLLDGIHKKSRLAQTQLWFNMGALKSERWAQRWACRNTNWNLGLYKFCEFKAVLRPLLLQCVIDGVVHKTPILCYAMLCYVMLCYVMLCYVMLCYVMLCYVMLCELASISETGHDNWKTRESEKESYCPRWRKLPSSPVYSMLHQLGGAWHLLRTALVWSHSWRNCGDTMQFLSPSVGSFESMAVAADVSLLRAVVACGLIQGWYSQVCLQAYFQHKYRVVRVISVFSAVVPAYVYYYLRLLDKTQCQTAPG